MPAQPSRAPATPPTTRSSAAPQCSSISGVGRSTSRPTPPRPATVTGPDAAVTAASRAYLAAHPLTDAELAALARFRAGDCAGLWRRVEGGAWEQLQTGG